MTAPVPMLNLAAPVGPAGAASAAAAAGPLAGFEALLAALFGAPQPQPAPPGVPQAQVMLPGQAEPPVTGEGEGQAEPQAQAPNPEAPLDGPLDPSLLGLLGAAEPAPEAPAAPAPETAEAAAPPAWGRDKARGEPAAPAFAHASPTASFQQAETPSGAPPAQAGPHAKAEPPPQAQAVFQRAAAPPPAEVPPPGPAPVAAGSDAPPPAAVPAAAPIPAAAAAAAVLAPKPAPQPPAAQPQAQPARSERSRAAQPDAAPAPTQGPVVAAKAARLETPAAETVRPEAAADGGRAPEAPEAPDPAPVAAESRAQASAAPASSAGPPPVRGAPETVANLAAQIVKKLEGRSTRFDLELTPAGLGKVDVRLEIAAHGRITAAMSFDNPQAAAELKARSGELQRALEQAGFDLSGGLSFDVSGDRGHARQGWGEAGADAGRRFPGEAFQAALDNAGEADAAGSGELRLRRGVTAGVDVRI